MKSLRFLWVLPLLICNAEAAKIAVTDLTYSERVSGYFHLVDYHNKSSARASQTDREREGLNSYSGSSRYSESARSETDYTEIESSYSYIEYGELRKFVGDIKGELLKTSGFQLTQGKPYTSKGTEKIYDIIDRIKKGYYPGADYVLFGTVSELDFRDEENPVIGTNANSNTFSLMLVAEFSLINTKTYEVKAAFSANGDGQDVRMVTGGSRVVPSRARVVSEVSKSLGVDVARQINEQLGSASSGAPMTGQVGKFSADAPGNEQVISFSAEPPVREASQADKAVVVETRPEVKPIVNRVPLSESSASQNTVSTESSSLNPGDFGKYYALVIGNNDYQFVPKLDTAENDAKEVAQVLQSQYGFNTKLLLNAKRNDILDAINAFKLKLNANDNFIIYYAGHGIKDVSAYWLPVDAKQDSSTEWIQAETITTELKKINSNHILIISDSCYSGELSRNITPINKQGNRDYYLKKLLSKKSRTLIASGGNEPVADAGGGNHSVFTKAFIDGLKNAQDSVFTDDELFNKNIKEVVAGNTEQTPQYNALKNSGHEDGSFIFVKKR